jgi:Tol biopolymer transport system component
MIYSCGRCSISPDGSTIVFNEMSGPNLAPGVAFDIYSIKADGSGLTQLTSGPIVRSSPWFSPDGRSIVYVSAAPDDQGSNVCVMDRDGHNPRQLTFGHKINCITPSYSQDGSKIIFACAARHRLYSMGGLIWGDWDIWDMNADGSSLRQLTFERYYQVDPPYISPEGKHVLFGADLNTGSADTFRSWHSLLIFDILKDGSAANLRQLHLPTTLTEWNYDGQPSLSPDGATIVFTSLRISRPTPFDYEIWTAGIDGTNLRQITHNQSRSQNPIFSPDGKFIYYWIPTGGLWRMAADGSDPRKLVP